VISKEEKYFVCVWYEQKSSQKRLKIATLSFLQRPICLDIHLLSANCETISPKAYMPGHTLAKC